MNVQKFDFRPEDVVVFTTPSGLVEVFVPCKPHTHAEFGGHLVIRTKAYRWYRHEFTKEEALELMALSQAVELLMMESLGAAFCNFQDNGNWSFLPGGAQKRRCHLHAYGRSGEENSYTGPGAQTWGKSLDFPLPTEPGLDAGTTWLNYIHPYSDQDIDLIKAKLPRMFDLYYNSLVA